MKAGFYSKTAVENLKKNPRLYVPRILSEAGLLGCFYILISLATDKRMSDTLGGGYLTTMMKFGSVVLAFLSFVLILYINSFLMKQRKNEYGLYNVLGLEKKHIIKILFSESFFTSLFSISAGTAIGTLFYKFSSLIICRLLEREAVAGFYYISVKSLLLPALIFATFDFFAFIVNAFSIQRMKPVELLSQKHVGEKEPRVKWPMLISGIISLGAGYTIALVTKSPLEAIFLFFIAVLLVVIGTYFLFITGTTFILKCLRNRKKYYYNKKHMPAVSGLLFRMKQNAVGLASIAILSTCVLVMVSTTFSLYFGVEDSMNHNYPQELYLSGIIVSKDKQTTYLTGEQLEDAVREAAADVNVGIKEIDIQNFLSVSYVYRNKKLLTKTEVENGWETDEITGVVYITENSYAQLTGRKITVDDKKTLNLKPDEIAYCRISSNVEDSISNPESLYINGKEFKVKKSLEFFPVSSNTSNIVRNIGIVVSDENVLNEIYTAQKKAYGKDASEYTNRIGVSFENEEEAGNADNELCSKIFDIAESKYSSGNDDTSVELTVDSKWSSKKNMLEMYGTFLFLGILLGFVCLFSTILIIYYKQISEGYEDRERFHIMEKIGMEEKEVRKTIGSQLVLQFFMPLITAGIHISVAFPILLKLLKVLMLTNTTLFLVCTLVTFVVFCMVYTSVYLLTAKTYYKIVH